MIFPEIDTPAAVVDLDLAEANITRFQQYCDQHGLATRPHIKTHKLQRLARAQLAAGAIGITCQKVSEAEAMTAGGGINNVLITYNILGESKRNHLRDLAARINVSVVADNETVIDGLSQTFAAAKPLDVLIECDTGADRCGVQSAEQALHLAQRVIDAPGLHFSGLMTYPPAGNPAAVQSWLLNAKTLIEQSGIAVPVVSTGGTPDMWRAHEVPVATEWRAGTYVYNDRSLVERGACQYADCALTVLVTVVSRPTEHRAIIDAGSKTLTSDLLGLTGYGYVVDHPNIDVDQLSEEHGRLTSAQPIPFKVGDRLRIIPNHACVVSNMLSQVAGVRNGDFIGYLAVDARGCVT